VPKFVPKRSIRDIGNMKCISRRVLFGVAYVIFMFFLSRGREVVCLVPLEITQNFDYS